MKLSGRIRRLTYGLVALMPVAAAVVALAASPAQAWYNGNHCNGNDDYTLCQFKDASYSVAAGVLHTGQGQLPNYANMSGPCENGSWNDCVSSLQDKMTVYQTCLYQDLSYFGNYLPIEPGQNIADLTHVGGGFNDVISSSQTMTQGANC